MCVFVNLGYHTQDDISVLLFLFLFPFLLKQTATNGRVGPVTCLGTTVDLALVEHVWVIRLHDRRAEELVLPVVAWSTGWPSWSSTGELTLGVWVQESWWTDYITYIPVLDSGPWVNHLWPLGGQSQFWSWVLKQGPLKEQAMLLTAELSPWFLNINVK